MRAPGSKFFQFHAAFGKFWQNRMFAPPGELAPLLGEILDPPLRTTTKIATEQSKAANRLRRRSIRCKKI